MAHSIRDSQFLVGDSFTTNGPGGVPASTFATQLIQNHADTDAREKPDARLIFGQLLQALLEDEGDVIDDDLEIASQLISVVVEAGLDVLHKADKNAENYLLLDQAVDSIAVIQKTIMQKPDILFHIRPSENPEKPYPPTWQWLFAKLISIIGLEGYLQLQPHVETLLSTLGPSLLGSIKFWTRTEVIAGLYDACVEDVLQYLDELDVSECEPGPFFVDAQVPYPRYLEDNWGETERPDVLPTSSHATFHHLHQLFLLCLVLLTARERFYTSGNSSMSFGSRSLMIVDQLVRLWGSYCSFADKHLNRNAQSVCIRSFAQTLALLTDNEQLPSYQRYGKLLPVLNGVCADIADRCCLNDLLSGEDEVLAELLTKLKPWVNHNHTVKSAVEDDLLDHLWAVQDDEDIFVSLPDYLQIALTGINDLFPYQDSSDDEDGVEGALSQMTMETDISDQSAERPPKKRRVSELEVEVLEDQALDVREELLESIARLVGGQETLTADLISAAYDTWDEETQLGFFEILARIACACTNCYTITDSKNQGIEGTCSHCDNPEHAPTSEAVTFDGQSHKTHLWENQGMLWDGHQWIKPQEDVNNERQWAQYHNLFFSALIGITGLETFQHSETQRFAGMLALRRLLCHTRQVEYLDLSTSALGQWCLKSLHSTQRALRIAASNVLPYFLHSGLEDDLTRRNRLLALHCLRSLWEKAEIAEQETLVYTWGQVALVCGDSELNVILYTLVSALGSPSGLISNSAFCELLRLAELRKITPEYLLKPFWPSISLEVVKDLLTNPQKAQNVADLLDVSVNEFLLLTQRHTVPSLILWKRTDILEKIAAAKGAGNSLQDVCMQPWTTFAAVMAVVLLQVPPAEMEKGALDLLCAVVPAFGTSDIATLVKLEPILIACEVLKKAGDAEDEVKKELTHHAFRNLARIVVRKGKRSSSNESDALAAFFDAHALGMMAHFSDVIDDARGDQVLLERLRCIRAVEEMISVAGSNSSVCLPQIRACLQSAMEDDQLLDQAFSAWITMVMVLDAEEIAAVFNHTIALINLHWVKLHSEIQQRLYETVGHVLRVHNNTIRDDIDSVPAMAGIPLMSKYHSEISRLKNTQDLPKTFGTFARRCQDENGAMVEEAARELYAFLEEHQSFVHEYALTEQPNSFVNLLQRALLDAIVRFGEDDKADELVRLCQKCLGVMGALDPNRHEVTREKKDLLVLSNFDSAQESVEFVTYLLEEFLVKTFHSVTNARAQGFLAYVMQELLRFCGYDKIAIHVRHARASQGTRSTQTARLALSDPVFGRWLQMPENVRNTLTPFLTSKYILTSTMNQAPEGQPYPIYAVEKSHSVWIRAFTFDLLLKANGDNPKMIFPLLARIVRGNDTSISAFLLPFAVLNVVVGGVEQEVQNICTELLAILHAEPTQMSSQEAETLKQCSESVFQILDYLSRWMQERKRAHNAAKSAAGRQGRPLTELEEIQVVSQISSIERVVSVIPPEILSNRALACRSYARALLSWETYMRALMEKDPDNVNDEEYLNGLHLIYSQIDDADSIEGVAVTLQMVNPYELQYDFERPGRWTAAQTWYENRLHDIPEDGELQLKLLKCLSTTGQHQYIINFFENQVTPAIEQHPDILKLSMKAAIVSRRWELVEKYSAMAKTHNLADFDYTFCEALLALRRRDAESMQATVDQLYRDVKNGLSVTSTSSLQNCHTQLFGLHQLYELEKLCGFRPGSHLNKDREYFSKLMDSRLEVLGAQLVERQQILQLRRTIIDMRLPLPTESVEGLENKDLAATLLKEARVARKLGQSGIAYAAVLHALELGNAEAQIEHSRLLWKDDKHREAISTLTAALDMEAFASNEINLVGIEEGTSITGATNSPGNLLEARAHLLLAKWLDQSGQMSSMQVTKKYQDAVKCYPRWEKGQYYLGKHYNKLFEVEKALPTSKQSRAFLCGETAKLVVESYTRSLRYGCKYIYQTMPRLLTLWLDLGQQVVDEPESKARLPEKPIIQQRAAMLERVTSQVLKYHEKLSPYQFYTAFTQLLSRISHPQPKVSEALSNIILKIVNTYPQQALWSVLAVSKSTDPLRCSRGMTILNRLKDKGKKSKVVNLDMDFRTLINHSQKLTDSLLHASEVDVEGQPSTISLVKTLHFNRKMAPSALVIPLESTLTASLPAIQDVAVVWRHKPFARDAVTIADFLDEVLVLNSLQKPRKLTIRGSDGKLYGLLCKPHDDLRLDQRLMEFNGMINRALKSDAETSKRQLYIKTYGVMPLNERCGTIEWVDGLKPMRDIIMKIYKQKGVRIDFNEVRNLLNEACAGRLEVFTDTLLTMFPPILYEWFVEVFPEPDVWYAARLRYARSCAVTSISGYILGLGDRHGENILLQEGSGGVFHVDFNCLFDKGLTFEKPEMVPFRLTHNMIDAMGASQTEGVFRISCQLTMGILRQYQDTLMTILETFVYDPTTDFTGVKKRTKSIPGVPDTPQDILDNVSAKLKGLLKGESVPLSVEGHVDALISMATNPANLCSMYIGWCAFF